MDTEDRPLVWLEDRVQTPPFSVTARIEAGKLLRLLQRGERLGMPHCRPMPSIGPHVHELRIQDEGRFWRIVLRIDPDAVIVAAVFAKKTTRTPRSLTERCRRRFRAYDRAMED